jgi:hypothetical protein
VPADGEVETPQLEATVADELLHKLILDGVVVGDAVEAESELITTRVMVTLPVLVLVRADEPFELFLVMASTFLTVAQVEEGVETVTVHDEVVGYPAVASSKCHVEQLVIVMGAAMVQD